MKKSIAFLATFALSLNLFAQGEINGGPSNGGVEAKGDVYRKCLLSFKSLNSLNIRYQREVTEARFVDRLSEKEAKEIAKIALAPKFALFAEPSKAIIVWSISS